MLGDALCINRHRKANISILYLFSYTALVPLHFSFEGKEKV